MSVARRGAAVGLAMPWLLLAIAHGGALATMRAPVAALLVVEDLLVAALLVARRPARHASWLPADCSVALGATALPLALSAPAGLGSAAGLELLGVALAVVATATLGRDLGILPALRGVTTRGVYAVVRHPMYAAHLLIGTAYVLGAPSWRNAGVALAVGALLLVRLRREESLLAGDRRYRAYCARVPWRLVPGCY